MQAFTDIRIVKLSTPVPFQNDKRKVHYADHLLFMGSCFSEHIGGWMGELQFDALPNPSGIIYNPISLAKHLHYGLRLAAEPRTKSFREEVQNALETSQGLYVHCDFHSHFAAPDAHSCTGNIAKGMADLAASITQADVLFVTICLANQSGIDLTDALRRNLDKKTRRDADRHRANAKLAE